MYLLILESIGTQELILIGIIALIVFGPRKIPQLAKTVGKTMADFRKVTHEFKSTWEKEVEEDSKLLKTFASDPEVDAPVLNPVQETTPNLLAPQVKELSAEDVAKLFPSQENQKEAVAVEEDQNEKNEEAQPVTLSKRDWL